MHPELEALIKAYDAFLQAGQGGEAQRLFALYDSKLEHAADGLKVGKDALHRAVKKQYLRWIRATTPPSTLPSTA